MKITDINLEFNSHINYTCEKTTIHTISSYKKSMTYRRIMENKAPQAQGLNPIQQAT